MKQRVDWLDVLKGIGIVLVVISHQFGIEHLHNYFLSFDMPLFFIISGLLLNEKKYNTVWEFAKTRIKSLMVPFWCFYFVLLLYWLFVERRFRYIEITPWEGFFGLFWAADSRRWIFPAGVLWFLPALFSLEVLYFSVIKQKFAIWLKWAILFALFVIGMLLAKYHLLVLPWGLNNALISIPFFAVGHILREPLIKQNALAKIPCDRYKISFLLLAIALSSVCWIFCDTCKIQISQIEIEGYLQYLTLPFFGTFSYVFLSKFIGPNKLIEWVGRNTLPILAFHPPLIRILLFAAQSIFGLSKGEVRGNVYYSIIIVVTVILICWPLAIIWNRFYKKFQETILVKF